MSKEEFIASYHNWALPKFFQKLLSNLEQAKKGQEKEQKTNMYRKIYSAIHQFIISFQEIPIRIDAGCCFIECPLLLSTIYSGFLISLSALTHYYRIKKANSYSEWKINEITFYQMQNYATHEVYAGQILIRMEIIGRVYRKGKAFQKQMQSISQKYLLKENKLTFKDFVQDNNSLIELIRMQILKILEFYKCQIIFFRDKGSDLYELQQIFRIFHTNQPKEEVQFIIQKSGMDQIYQKLMSQPQQLQNKAQRKIVSVVKIQNSQIQVKKEQMKFENIETIKIQKCQVNKRLISPLKSITSSQDLQSEIHSLQKAKDSTSEKRKQQEIHPKSQKDDQNTNHEQTKLETPKLSKHKKLMEIKTSRMQSPHDINKFRYSQRFSGQMLKKYRSSKPKLKIIYDPRLELSHDQDLEIQRKPKETKAQRKAINPFESPVAKIKEEKDALAQATPPIYKKKTFSRYQ